MNIYLDLLQLLDSSQKKMAECVANRQWGENGIMKANDEWAVKYREARLAYETTLEFLMNKLGVE